MLSFSNNQQSKFQPKCQRQRRQNESGFTLVEMLVSVALFAVVLTMSVGTLLILIDANGRAQSMQLVMTNLTFALDSMTREVRTGYNWNCFSSGSEPSAPDGEDMSDCTGGNVLAIVESGNSITGGNTLDERRITYWFDDDHYGSSPDRGAILRKIAGNSSVALTGPEIDIDAMDIVVDGTERYVVSNSDVDQPTVSLYISGTAGESGPGASDAAEREFSLQTTITQRLFDI